MHLVVCNWFCASRIGLGWAYDAFYMACHMFMHSSCIRTLISIYLLYLNCFGTFLIVSLSLPLSSVCDSLCLWHPNASLLHPETLFIPGHPLRLILLLHLFGSVMRMLGRPSRRTFLDEAFILNTKSSWRTSPILTYPLSFIVGVGSHCVTSRSHVHPCWFRSFTPTCMDLIFQYLILSLAFEVRTLLSHRRLLEMCFVSLR